MRKLVENPRIAARIIWIDQPDCIDGEAIVPPWLQERVAPPPVALAAGAGAGCSTAPAVVSVSVAVASKAMRCFG